MHYPPILLCFICPLTLYNLVVNIYPYENVYYYDSYVCGGACYQFETIAGNIDYFINIVIPTALITLANMILLLRVTHQKRAMKSANTWQKYRLVYVQLVSISILYFIIWIPFVIISLIRLFYDALFLQDMTMLIINYCLYICLLASPLICLLGLPTVRRNLRNSLCMTRITLMVQTRVRPAETINTQTG
ncbi:unnamed protein product [Rotaria magnacalcarata]|uniref:G-protein coupled receptors family 1 profile domain-containing protein n=1 Tax=Rotaria magnacalcarata TaxID=392030 RepID=A0A816N1A8_9BILA|nr:unnamed protein product [Rotaria magnacalcarata]CAF3878804.1 unnamed protein product [Rotaria magnacalcarata]